MKRKTIGVNRLTAGSVYKLVFVGSASFFLPFSLLMGLFALFGAETVRSGDRAITGLGGFLAAPFIGLLFVLLVTVVLGTMMAIGLWVFSLFKPLELGAFQKDNREGV